MHVVDGVHWFKNACSKQHSGPTHVFESGHMVEHWHKPPVAMSGIAMAMSGVAHVDAHAPLQQVCPELHCAPPHRHLPPEQCEPPAQTFPHMPQLKSSEPSDLHPLTPQHDCPCPHATPDGGQPHAPPEHT